MLVAALFPGWPSVTNQKWVRRPQLESALRGVPGMGDFRRVYESPVESLRVITAWHPGHGWHLSISHPSRYPVWDEIKAARYDLLPDACTMGMLLPPKGEYVALHPNCFHLHQVADDDGAR